MSTNIKLAVAIALALTATAASAVCPGCRSMQRERAYLERYREQIEERQRQDAERAQQRAQAPAQAPGIADYGDRLCYDFNQANTTSTRYLWWQYALAQLDGPFTSIMLDRDRAFAITDGKLDLSNEARAVINAFCSAHPTSRFSSAIAAASVKLSNIR